MHHVDLAGHVLEPSRNDIVMKFERAHSPKKFIRDTIVSLSERRPDVNAQLFGKRFLENAGKNSNIGSSSRQAVHLLPGSSANAVRTQFMGKTVEYADLFFDVHLDQGYKTPGHPLADKILSDRDRLLNAGASHRCGT